MALAILAGGVVLLLVLIIGFKLDGFFALLITAFLVGVLEGIPFNKVAAVIYTGIGSQLKSLILILAFGAMIGKLLADSGGAQRIANTLIAKFGEKRVQAAIIFTSIIVGATMFFEPAFIIMLPIIYTVCIQTKLPLVYIGIPAVCGLTVTNSFLPPHPGPTAVAGIYGADLGTTLLMGIPIAIPAAIIVGMLFTRTKILGNMTGHIPEGLATSKVFTEEEMPSFPNSVLTVLIPILLIMMPSIGDFFLAKTDPLYRYFHTFGDAPVAMFLALMVSIYTLGISKGRSMTEVMHSMSESVKSIAMIVLVIAAGGAFKEVLVEAGVGHAIVAMANSLPFSPLILVWVIAAMLRIAVGSASVAQMTAAGIALPIMVASGIRPELMVLATACGSVFGSHVNDAGFWMFKEFFGLTVVETVKARTGYTCVISICGLIGVLILHMFF